MTMIQIERLSGPQTGRTTTHAPGESITFGRSAESTVHLGGAHLSRLHGEIGFDGVNWWLGCQGVNPVRVDRRRVRPGRSVVLHGDEVVTIQDEPLFALRFVAAAAPDADHTAYIGHAQSVDLTDPNLPVPYARRVPAAGGGGGGGAGPATCEIGIPENDIPADEPASQRLSRRSRLWIGIGVYMLVIVGAFAVLSGLSGQRDAALAMPPQLADEQIAREISEPLERLPDARQAARHTAEAQQWYARSESSPDGLFLAHHHYKLARAYAGLGPAQPFDDSLDQLRFREVEQRLTQQVQQDYRQAYALAHNREWRAAEDALRQMLHSYTPPPEQGSQIVNNLHHQLRVVTRSQPRDRFR